MVEETDLGEQGSPGILDPGSHSFVMRSVGRESNAFRVGAVATSFIPWFLSLLLRRSDRILGV